MRVRRAAVAAHLVHRHWPVANGPPSSLPFTRLGNPGKERLLTLAKWVRLSATHSALGYHWHTLAEPLAGLPTGVWLTTLAFAI